MFGKVTTILFQEWNIVSSAVYNVLTTSDVWLKLELKMLVYRGEGVSISGYRGMAVGIEANICRRFFWCGVGMERPDSYVDEEHIGI